MRFLRFVSCFVFGLLLFASALAQDVAYSLPQSLPYGGSSAYVLGRNSEGVIVRLSGRSQDWMLCYSVSTLDLKWKKEIEPTEKNTDVREAYLIGDSIVVMYTANVHGNRVLKANLYSPRMNPLRNARALDTVPSLLGEDDNFQFAASPLHTNAMVFNQPDDFNRKKEINYVVLNAQLQTVRSGRVVANGMDVPELLNGYVLDNGDAFFVCGDNNGRNYNNAYRYDKVGVYFQTGGGSRFVGASKENAWLGQPVFRIDAANGGWVMTGLYADKPGNEAQGTYFVRGNLGDTLTPVQQFMPFTDDFLTNVTGQQGRKSRGFFDYVPTDLVVRRDGGAVFVTEAQTQYSENLSATRFNTMGAGPGMVTNHFFYNDLVVFAVDSAGAPQWNQVLRKKQQSDNDGGYYLSYGMLVGPKQLWLVYNDRVGGANNLSGYSVSATGDNKRTVLIDTDRKNLAPVPAQAKQIAPNALVIPSLRRGYFQLIKITFPT